MKKKYIALSIIFAVLLIGVAVGVTYAFFNYTRTGNPNTIGTGRIAFNAQEGDTVTLSNLFPIVTSGNVTSETPGVGSVEVHVTGDTNYDEGIEYLVTAVNVTSTSGNTSLPISVNISYEPSAGNGKTIGDEDSSYFTNRGGNTSLYKVLSTNTIAEGQKLVVGYIAPGVTGIDGNLVITAWLDASNIAITDTYPERTYYGYNSSMTASEISTCESYSLFATGFTGTENVTDFCAGTGTRGGKTFQEYLDDVLFTPAQLEDLLADNIIKELYTDGTDINWVNGRTVFTTTEWNELSTNGVSFQIKVEANEGTWVPSN